MKKRRGIAGQSLEHKSSFKFPSNYWHNARSMPAFFCSFQSGAVEQASSRRDLASVQQNQIHYYSIENAFWCMKSANYKILKLRILRKSIRLPICIGIQLLLFYQYLFFRSHHKMTLKVDDARSEVKFQHFLKLSFMVVVYVLFLLPPMMFQMMMAFVLSIKQ